MRSKNLDVRLSLINESVWCVISGCPRHLSPPTTVSRLHLGIKAVSLMFRHVDYLIISGENTIKLHPHFHNFTNKPSSVLHLNCWKQTKVSSPEVICMMTTIMWKISMLWTHSATAKLLQWVLGKWITPWSTCHALHYKKQLKSKL